jgi:hypothetical protein
MRRIRGGAIARGGKLARFAERGADSDGGAEKKGRLAAKYDGMPAELLIRCFTLVTKVYD